MAITDVLAVVALLGAAGAVYYDVRRRVIPDRVPISILLAALLFRVWGGGGLEEPIYTGCVVFAAFWVLSRAGYAGEGDATLMGALGFALYRDFGAPWPAPVTLLANAALCVLIGNLAFSLGRIARRGRVNLAGAKAAVVLLAVWLAVLGALYAFSPYKPVPAVAVLYSLLMAGLAASALAAEWLPLSRITDGHRLRGKVVVSAGAARCVSGDAAVIPRGGVEVIGGAVTPEKVARLRALVRAGKLKNRFEVSSGYPGAAVFALFVVVTWLAGDAIILLA